MSNRSFILRKEGRDKLTGAAKYIDDMVFDDMLHGATIRSPIPRGLLKNIHFEGSTPWDEFTIVTAKDIPGKNFITMIENDWPFLVEEKINHMGEAVALIAHPDKNVLRQALKDVRVETEELPPVYSIEDSLAVKEKLWKDDNVFKSFHIVKGDVDSVWKDAAHIIEGEYRTGAQEQLYIENNGMISSYCPDDGVTIWGSMQCPYYVHKAIYPLFDLPENKVRIIQAETGGGFGGKEEFPSLLAGHTALLAKKAGKPVKMIYSRTEDMAHSTKRHPSRSVHKTAVDKDGKILAMDIDFVLDGGAYFTLSSVVLSRGCIHAAGPYNVPNVSVKARTVATNTFPHGAFRGFGAPQSIFALERHLDVIAEKIGLTPEEFRRRNFLKEGDKTATGQELKEVVDFDKLLDSAFEKSGYHQKLKDFAEHNKNSHIKKGIGFSSFMHGAGFTGSGEVYLASVVKVRGTLEGKVEVLTSSTEMGQGKNTVFTQIIADELGIHPEDVEIVMPDTKVVPDSGPTVASRTSMVVGQLIKNAAATMNEKLINNGNIKREHTRDEFVNGIKAYVEKEGALEAIAKYQQPPNVHWDDEKYQGEAYATYAWAVYLAEVSVNTLTYETRVDNFTAIQEVGNVLHPTLAAGQIEGGVAQGIGYAIYEKVVYDKGHMKNNQMTNYIMPTASDVPEIKVYFEEWNKKYGPGGAKGIGELPMDGPAPAVINAVANATGLNITNVPMLPEDLMEAYHGR